MKELKRAKQHYYVFVVATIAFIILAIYQIIRTDYYTGEVYNMNSIIRSSSEVVPDSRFQQKEWYKLNLHTAYGPFISQFYSKRTDLYTYVVLLEDNTVIAVKTEDKSQITEILDRINKECTNNGFSSIDTEIEGYLKPIGTLDYSYNNYIKELKDKKLLDDSVRVRSLLLDTSHSKQRKTVGFLLLGFVFPILTGLSARYYYGEYNELKKKQYYSS